MNKRQRQIYAGHARLALRALSQIQPADIQDEEDRTFYQRRREKYGVDFLQVKDRGPGLSVSKLARLGRALVYAHIRASDVIWGNDYNNKVLMRAAVHHHSWCLINQQISRFPAKTAIVIAHFHPRLELP